MVIVDASVWIDYLGGGSSPETLWLDRELKRQRIGLADLTLCEVLQGIANEITARRVQKELCMFAIWSISGIRRMCAAGDNYRALRARGYTVRKTIDCLIATFCIEGGHELLHRDHDFDPFEQVLGLRVIRAA